MILGNRGRRTIPPLQLKQKIPPIDTHQTSTGVIFAIAELRVIQPVQRFFRHRLLETEMPRRGKWIDGTLRSQVRKMHRVRGLGLRLSERDEFRDIRAPAPGRSRLRPATVSRALRPSPWPAAQQVDAGQGHDRLAGLVLDLPGDLQCAAVGFGPGRAPVPNSLNPSGYRCKLPPLTLTINLLRGYNSTP